MDPDSFILCIKKMILETKFDTLNCELDRPLLIGKI